MDEITPEPASDSVDEYMQHVGSMLYEIICDWVKEKEALKRGEEAIPDSQVGKVRKGESL